MEFIRNTFNKDNPRKVVRVVLEINDGETVTRIEEEDQDIINAWYDLNYAAENGTNRDCDSALLGLESLCLEKHGSDCNFLGEVIFEADVVVKVK